MSYQKKSLILQELEQAIRKKAQQKSRHKDQANRALQSSVEKKKNTVKGTTNKDNRIAPIYKPSETATKPNRAAYEPLSLFNNQQLNTIEGGEFKFKKYNNRRLDKLVSLVQYMVSSSEKAVKYISSTNFQAEFALKLYRSDKDNLMNELKTLNLEDIVEQRSYDKQPGKTDVNSLLQQNTKLKKEIMILEKQAERFHQKEHSSEFEFVSPKNWSRESSKLQEMFRKLVPFETFKSVIELLEKQTKFEQMLTKSQQNTKKLTEIEMNISSLQHERLNVIESFLRTKDSKIEGRSDRTVRLNQIQGQKQNLQRQISNLKQKLNEIKQSSKSIGEVELLKKSSELMNERLASLANDLSKNVSVSQKRSNEQLIDLIRSISLNYMQMQQDLSAKILQLNKQSDGLKRQNLQYRKYKKENEEQFNESEQKMEKMISEIQQFKGVIEQLQNDRENAIEQINQLQSALRDRQQKLQNLNQDLNHLEDYRQETQELQSINIELKKQLQVWTKKCEEKDRAHREKLAKAQNGKNALEDRILEMAEELESQRSQIALLNQQNEVAGKSEITAVSDIKLQFKNKEKQHSKKLQQLQRKLDDQLSKFNQLKDTYEETVNEIIKVSKLSNQKSNRIEQQETVIQQQKEKIKDLQLKSRVQIKIQPEQDSRIEDLQQENASLRSEINKMKGENASLIQRLRSTQNQIISNNYAVEELNSIKKQNSKLHSKIKELDEASVKTNSKINEGSQKNNSLQIQLQEKQKQLDELSEKYQKDKAIVRSNEQTINQLTKGLTNSSSDCQLFKQEKLRIQKELEEQMKRYNVEVQSFNRRLQAGQLDSTKMDQKYEETRRSLDSQRNRAASLIQKIDSQSKQILKLREDIASLTAQIEEYVSNHQHSEQMLASLIEEKEQLSSELNATKQQIADQIDMNQHKMQQYVNLLKQILKGFEIESQDLADKNTFEQLLEFGSKQVVQMRKRLRDEESNKRRNSRKQKDYQDYEFQQSEKTGIKTKLQECKVQLFSLEKNASPISIGKQSELAKIEAKPPLLSNQQHDLNEFNEFNNQDPMNNSITSQQNQNANEFNLQEFADHEQKMNSSMLSDQEVNQPKKSIPNEKGHISKAFQSFKFAITKDEPKVPEKERSPIDKKIQNLVQFKANKITNSAQSPKLLGNTSGFSQKQRNKSQLSESNSNKLGDFKLKNLDQFQQVKSDDMNESLVSQEMNEKEDVNEQDLSQQLGSSLQKTIKEQQDQVEDHKHGQLKHIKANPGNFILNSLGGNFFGYDQEDDLDDSLHSDQERGLSEFDQVNNDRMGDSILSKKEGEHGLSQFGQVQDCQMTDSILSQKPKKVQPKLSGRKFDQFQQYKYGVGDSLASQKTGQTKGKAAPYSQASKAGRSKYF